MSSINELQNVCDDEDVELENTPLYQYMQEYENIERPKPRSPRWSTWSFYREILKKFNCQLTPSWLSTGRQAFRKYAQQNHSVTHLNEMYRVAHQSTIKDCSLLLEDDFNFLENITSDETKEVICNERQMYTKKFILPVLVLGCWKIQSFFNKNPNLLRAGLALSACTMAYSVVSVMLLFKRKRDLSKSLKITKTFVTNCEELLRFSQKCLTYIREMEIFGKGMSIPVPEFSLSRIGNSSLFVTSSLPLPRMCALIPLRIVVITSLRKHIQLSRSSLFQLFELYPLNRQIDSKQNYFAYFNNTEVIDLLNKEISDETSEFSAEICFTPIKCLFQLLHLHLSEFLRRLCLCFCIATCSTSSSSIDPFSIGEVLLKKFTEEIQMDFLQLNESYKLNQYYSSTWKKECQPPTSRLTSQSNHNCEALNSSLKSLSLHLLASLARIHEITDNLSEEESDQYATILSQLQLIQQDIQASEYCIEESLARLMKIHGQNDAEGKDSPIPLQLPSTCSSNPAVPVIPLSENVDIASQDEVFEAYFKSNDDEDLDDANKYTEIDMVVEKQREISRKLFSELKTVLVPKAKEWKAREAKALGMTETDESDSSNGVDASEDTKCLKRSMSDEAIYNSDSDSDLDNRHHLTNYKVYHLPQSESNDASFSSDIIASVASLAARKARSFLKEDECFECDN